MSGGAALRADLPEPRTLDGALDLTVKIGETAISLLTDDARFRRMIEDRYCGFVARSAQPHYQFDVTLTPPNPARADEDVRVAREGARWRAERGDFTATWDPATGRGCIRQSPNPYSADTLLRIVHSIRLAQTGGFLLHAASAVRNGRAFLFSGVSGAGKTTLSRLAPPDARVLTDEMSYVVKEAKGYRACGTPFAGELARIGENISAPIAGLFFLEKSGQNRLLEVEPGVALAKLMRNILFLANDADLVSRVFQAAVDFVSLVPAHSMQFTPDSSAWDVVR
jgi:hypothetical protein